MNILTNLSILILIFLHYIKSQGGGTGGGAATSQPATKYTLNLSDLYPSFTQLDIIYDSITGLTQNCPENCIKCTINNNGLVICVTCKYGYALYLDNICVKCPNDCSNECSMYSYNENSIWGVNPYCYSNSKAYYFENNVYIECSNNCHLCHSNTDCEECLGDGALILQYNGPNNFSCESCTGKIPGCSTCNLYSNKKKRNILYSDLKIYKNLEEYNIDEYEIICLYCIENYFYDETTKSCLTCSSIIPDCISCRQGEGIVKIICHSCSSGKTPFYDKLLNKIICKTCSEIIPYCSNCKYGLYLNETLNFIDSSNLIFIDLYLLNSNYTMRCIECKTNYGTDLRLITCQSCPLNCEYCNLIETNMFCGRCSSGYVLSIYEGICYLISYYTNLTSASIKTYCSKIVSENPWVANISSTSNPFLCQECKDSIKYPSISGICDKCVNNTCSSCIESSGLPENLSSIVYTKLLKTQPYSLIGKIDSGTIVSSIQRCLTCNNENYALNSKFQACCTPNTLISQNPKISYIDKCLTCQSCDIISSIIACDVCSVCIDTQFINNDMTVNVSNVGSSLFQKKIYLFLKENPDVIQTTNPTQTYSYLYGNLTYQKNIDFLSKFIMKCSACPINSVNCYTDEYSSIFLSKLSESYKKFFSDFSPSIKDFTEVFSYFTKTKECKPNFVYDYSYRRCKFCPNDWKSCKSYKKIEINFVGDSKSINDAFTVKTIDNLDSLLKNIYSSEFLFISNEFMVETIEIIVNLDSSEELFFYDEINYQLNFVGLFNSLIPSLTSHKLTFQPDELSTNPSARSAINLGCFLVFSDYTEVNFINIDIRGYTNYFTNLYIRNLGLDSKLEMKTFGISINTVGPGSYGNILNCKLFAMNANKILVNNVLKEEGNPFNEFSNDNSLILCNLISFNFNGNTNIINFEIIEFNTINYSDLSKINKIFDTLKLKGLFVFDTKSDFNITNLIIKNSNFTNGLTLFYIISGVNYFNLLNIDVENCFFELTNFINHQSLKLNVSNMKFNNSIVKESNIIISPNGINCYITEIKILNAKFYGDYLNGILNILFSFKIVQFNDVIINKSYFRTSQLFDFPVIITVKEEENFLIFKNILIEDNIFTPSDSDNAFLFSLEFISSSLYNLNILNFSIFNNKIVISETESYLSINLTFYCFKIVNVMKVNLKEIIFKNNYGFSGFYCDSVMLSIEIINFKFFNDEIIRVLQTPLYLSDILGICVLNLLFIENIITDNDLIRISNNIASYLVSGKYELMFSNSTINNIILYVPDVSIGSPFYLTSKLPMEIEIFNCNFFNNILYDDSQYEGSTSGISIDSPISSLTMTDCNFVNLRSTGKYNVFKGFLLNATILFCNFSFGNFYDQSNASLIIENKIIALGTFINCLAKYINIISCSFKNGYALYGGAIYYAQLNKISFLNINNCYFYNIYSFGDGGVIYLSTSNDKLLHIEITKSNFEYIGGFGNGGVIFSKMLNKPELKIIESNFTRFMAIQGSLIYSDQTNISMEKNNIAYNYNVLLSETYLFFDVHPYLKFPDDINIATLFQITKSSLRFSQLIIENLVSSNYLSEKGVTILSCISSNFQDNNSIYKNISFLVSVISVIEVGNITINNSKFLNNYFRSNSKMVLFQENYIPFSFNTQIEGLIYVVISEFLLENTLFQDNMCIQCSKGLILNSQSSMGSIHDCIFKHNSFASGGSLNFAGFNAVNNDINSAIIINNSLFEGNQALNNSVGAVKISESRTIIENCTFYNNFANELAGAIFFVSINQEISFLYIKSCIFERNSAKIGGAIYYIPISINIDEKTIFKDNKADYYGNNLYSTPEYLCQLEVKSNMSLSTCSENTIIINDFRSGNFLNPLILRIFDEEKYPMTTTSLLPNPTLIMNIADKDSKAAINESNSISMLMNDEEGYFKIDYLLISGEPLTSVIINFSSPDIMMNSLKNSVKTVKSYQLMVIINFRQCLLGEYYKKSSRICYECPQGTYSYNISEEICKTCFEGANCLGGNKTVLKLGYWRKDLFTETIINCDKLETACIGGIDFGNNLCAEGHIGAKCESCDLMGKHWGISYSRTTGNECVKCDDLMFNYIILAVVSLFNFISMALSIKGTIDTVNSTLKVGVIKTLARYGMYRIENNESSVYIKIYLSYFQIIQVLTYLKLNYPNWANSVQTTVGSPTSSALYSTDCLIALFSSALPYIYVKLVLALLIPLVYLLIFSLGYLLFISQSKYHRKYSMLYCVCLFTLIYFQPNIVENVISVLSCIKIGEETYIKADVSYICNNSDYWFYSFTVGIPALIVWAIATPGLILWRMIVNRQKLNTITNKIRYGYLYQEYRIFYWEFVRMYEKILVTVILSFYETEIHIKGLLVLMVLVTYFVLLFRFSPYKVDKMNKVDRINTSVCYISIFLGLLSYENGFDYIVTGSYIIIIIINVYFNIYIWRLILSTFIVKAEKTILFIKKKIIQIIPILGKIIKIKTINIQVLEKWNKARQLVGRYLREKERIKHTKSYSKQEDVYQLTLSDYDPNMVGVRKAKNIFVKTIKSQPSDYNMNDFDEKNNQLIMAESKSNRERNVREFITATKRETSSKEFKTKEDTNQIFDSPTNIHKTSFPDDGNELLSKCTDQK